MFVVGRRCHAKCAAKNERKNSCRSFYSNKRKAKSERETLIRLIMSKFGTAPFILRA